MQGLDEQNRALKNPSGRITKAQRKKVIELKKKMPSFGAKRLKRDYNLTLLWPQIQDNGLPKVQYTAREVASSLHYVAYAEERSLTYSSLFVDILINHLQAGKTVSREIKLHGILYKNEIQTSLLISRHYHLFILMSFSIKSLTLLVKGGTMLFRISGK